MAARATSHEVSWGPRRGALELFALHRSASPWALRPVPPSQLVAGCGTRRWKVQIPQSGNANWRERQQAEDGVSNVWWLSAIFVGIFGLVFASVPLYKIYCQSLGQGQATATGHKEYSAPPPDGSPASQRLVSVDFAATVHDGLPWEFVPQQRRVVVGLGETALAFYRARNKSERPIIGVSVYHMIPPEAGLYFNKIQCFCFDEQLINPHEEVDLPIFFFIDPLMAKDSRFDHVDRITLSYLFFESESELPEGYEEYKKAVPSQQAPPVTAVSLPVPAFPAPAAA